MIEFFDQNLCAASQRSCVCCGSCWCSAQVTDIPGFVASSFDAVAVQLDGPELLGVGVPGSTDCPTGSPGLLETLSTFSTVINSTHATDICPRVSG